MTNGNAIRSVYMEAEDMPVDYHRDAHALWQQRKGDRIAPSFKEMPLLDFSVDVIPLISVTDISANPLTSSYRFWGTALTQAFGGDFTGKSPADVPPKSLGMNINGGCGRLLKFLRPDYEVKEFIRHNNLFGRALVLRLPLSTDGINICNGMNIFYFETIENDQPLSAFFDEILKTGARRMYQ